MNLSVDSSGIHLNGLNDTKQVFLDRVASEMHEDHFHNTTAAQEVLGNITAAFEGRLGQVTNRTEATWQFVIDNIPDGAAKLTAELLRTARAFGHNLPFSQAPGRTPTGNSDGWLAVSIDPDLQDAQGFRIRTTKDLGIDSVKQCSGFFDLKDDGAIEHSHFFWFFESRNDPANDPLILWLGDGTGMAGAFSKFGPATIDADLKPRRNQYSLNNNANVVFLEVSSSFGYSYSLRGDGEIIGDELVLDFLLLFFDVFPQYKDNKLHVLGTSLGSFSAGSISSYLMGRGWEYEVYLSSTILGHYITDNLLASTINSVESDSRNKPLQKDMLIDVAAKVFNAHDTNTRHIMELSPLEFLNDSSRNYVEEYLNLPHVMDAFGASRSVQWYRSWDLQALRDYQLNNIQPGNEFKRLASLLPEFEIPVLIYAGQEDWEGGLDLALALKWPHSTSFASTSFENWPKNDQENSHLGEIRSFKELTFLRLMPATEASPELMIKTLSKWVNENEISYAKNDAHM